MNLLLNKIICGDSLTELKKMASESVDCVITSPPYWALRDYGVAGQLGLELTFQEYIIKLCDIFDEIKRVLKKTGTCWINLGDTYFGGGNNRGSSPENLSDIQRGNRGAQGQVQQDWSLMNYPTKSLCLIPQRFAIGMVERGWVLRNTIIWHKRNCMPSSVKDRFTVDFEYVFFFVKSKRYWFETQYEPFQSKPTKLRDKRNEGYGKAFLSPLGKGLRNGYEQGARNRRCVWTINTKPFKGAHFAVFPEKLVEPMIKAGCPSQGIVLDPFAGTGTTCVVAKKLNRNYIGIDLNPDYIKIAERRLINCIPDMFLTLDKR